MVRTVTGIGSGNFDLLDILLSGPDAWNQWRKENPTQPINLDDANLIGTNLSGANLRHADLSNADLSLAKLKDADLSNANLSNAKLIGTNLSGANLSCANLIGANLSGANLSGANLSGAELINAELSGANLSGAELSGANLSGANLRKANLSVANLRHAIITDETKIDPEWLSNPSQLTPLSEQTHCNIDIKVFDSEINSNDLVQLKSAIEKFVDASGYEEVTVISEQYGSWFKRVRLKIARLISQEVQEEAISAGQEFYRTGKASALSRLEKTLTDDKVVLEHTWQEIEKIIGQKNREYDCTPIYKNVPCILPNNTPCSSE